MAALPPSVAAPLPGSGNIALYADGDEAVTTRQAGMFEPIRADSIADATLIEFAIAAYSLPHHDERNWNSLSKTPAMLSCNRTDTAEVCADPPVWKGDRLTGGLGTLEYVFTADNGMQAGLYHYRRSDQFVLAFAGTDAAKHADLVEDVRVALARPVDRKLYETLVDQVDARMKALNPGARMDRHLTVTGHSLGGFQAQMFAAFGKVARFTTFSSPSAVGSIAATGKKPATGRDRGRHLYREGDSVADLVLSQYGSRIAYTATAYKLGSVANRVRWLEAQHSKEGFRAHLQSGAEPYGHIRSKGKKLRSKIVARLGVRYCVAGNINPLNEKFKVDVCMFGVTFDFDSNGMLRNKRVNDAFQTCMQAGGIGARVFMAQCDGGSSQIWHHHGDRFINAKTGKCLDWSRSSKSHLITWHCNGSANQRWEFS